MRHLLRMTCFCLFMTLILPLQAMAENQEDYIETNDCDMNGKIMLHHKAIKTHFDYYYELLIDKYRPELKEEWKEVSRERDVILKKIKEMKKEGKITEHPELKDEWKEAHSEYYEKFNSAIKSRDEEKIKSLLPDLLQLQEMWNEAHRELLKETED